MVQPAELQMRLKYVPFYHCETCAAIFATSDAKIKNRGIAASCVATRQFKDTYLSFLHATRDTEDDVCASSLDGTDIDVSSDDQEWDEEQPLVDAEMLGSP